MKYVLLLIVLLVGLLQVTSAEKQEKQEIKYITKCPKTCKCLPKYEPVCGTSGKTHSNECLAKCFKDTVKSQGPCKLKKCSKNEPYVKKEVCKVKLYGKTGRRKHCCLNYTKGNKLVQSTCKWVGCVSKREEKKNCYWVKSKKGFKQRKCCTWTEKSCGKKIKKGKISCKLQKRKFHTKFTNGCNLAPFRKNSVRNLCCRQKHVCLNDQCKPAAKSCHFKGGWTTTIRSIKCQWKSKHFWVKEEHCCDEKEITHYDEHGKKLKKTKVEGECKWSGKKYVLPKVTKCENRKYGRYGTRKRCCSYHNDCDSKNKCKQANVSCEWKGKTTYRIRQSKCVVKKSDGCAQSYCCKWTRRCENNKCVNLKKKCHFEGNKYCKSKSHKCYWKKNCQDGVRKFCCKTHKLCKGSKCKSKKTCKYVGKTVRRTSKTKCFWHTIEKHAKYQRKCCTTVTLCQGRLKCKDEKPVCKFIGAPIVYKYSGNCTLKKTGKHIKRKHCCKKVHKCDSKGEKCKQHKKECKYTGVTYKRVPKKKCVVIPYKVKGSERKRCCKWTVYCEDKKCKPLNKTCQWKGEVLKKSTETKCHWKKSGKHLKRRKCCYFEKKCKGKKCVEKKLRCSFTGVTLKETHHTKCHFKARGKTVRQKYCCAHSKSCTEGTCLKKNRGCGFVGEKYHRKVTKKCEKKRISKKELVYRKQCCSYTESCVGKKCKKHDLKCKWEGPAERLVHNTDCQYRPWGNEEKKNYCCHYTKRCAHFFKNGKNGEKCKVLKKDCSYKGNAIKLTSTFYKTTNYCEKVGNFNKCCKKLYLCNKVCNGEHICHLKNKNYECKHTKLVEKTAICISSGDPHYTTFDKKKFDLYRKGDYVLLKTKSVQVDSRLRTWGSTSVNTAIAAKLNSEDVIESVSKYANVWLINKEKVVHLKDGQEYTLPNGGTIHVKNSAVAYLYSKSGDFIDLRFNLNKSGNPQNVHITVIIKALNPEKAYGLCASSSFIKEAKGLFHKYYAGGEIEKVKCVGKLLKSAKRSCTKIGVCKADFNDCVIDVCNRLPAEDEKKMEKDLEKVKKVVIKKYGKKSQKKHGKKSQKKHGKKSQKKYGKKSHKKLGKKSNKKLGKKSKNVKRSHKKYSKKSKNVKKSKHAKKSHKKHSSKKSNQKKVKSGICQSTGDPHYVQLDGKKFDFHNYGEWVLLKSHGFTVHTRTKKWNNAAVNTDVVANVNGDIFKTIGLTNTYLINGVKTTLKKGDSLKLEYGGKVHQAEDNRVVVYAKNGEYIDCRIFITKTPQPYDINVIAFVPNVESVTDGLCLGKKVQGKGLFEHVHTPVIGKKPTDCNGEKRKHAEVKCKKTGFTGTALENCVIDVCEYVSIKQEKTAKKDVEHEKRKHKKSMKKHASKHQKKSHKKHSKKSKHVKKSKYEKKSKKVEKTRKVRQCPNITEKYDEVAWYTSAEEQRKYALERCKHENHHVFYSCVSDASKGLTKLKAEYEEVAKFINSKQGGLKKCYSSGDPHVSTFEGRAFDIYPSEKNRVIYETNDLKVSCDIEHDKRWAQRGINSACYVKLHRESFTIRKPINNQFSKCTSGLPFKETKVGNEQRYVINHGSTVVEFVVNVAGYINVFVTAPTLDTLSCKGDCCAYVKPVVTTHKGIEFRYGNPYDVKFRGPCDRKTMQVEYCLKKFRDSKECNDCIKQAAGKVVKSEKSKKKSSKKVNSKKEKSKKKGGSKKHEKSKKQEKSKKGNSKKEKSKKKSHKKY